MPRRKRLTPDLASVAGRFEDVVRVVEAAKESVVSSLPRARTPGRPLAEALVEFEDGLREAAEKMPAWREPALQAEWEACRAGLREALALAEHLRLDAPEMGFDQQAFTIQDLIAPLDAFGMAAERLRSLRT
jgi:hypothetical protein